MIKFGSTTALFDIYEDERYKKMKEYGFHYADLLISGELNGKSEREYRDDILRHKELADAAGVKIWQVHGPWRYPPHDETEERRTERAEVMKRSLRFTGMIGCRYWVIHPLMPFGTLDDFDPELFWQINLDFFRALLPYAKENGVTICFENIPMTKLSISSPEKTLQFIRMINDEHFKLCLDTGHCAVLGVQPADAVRLAGSDLAVMHVHDNNGTHDDHMVPFTGVIDWKAYCKALKEIGFDGVFSLEANFKSFLPRASHDLKLNAFRSILDEMNRLS